MLNQSGTLETLANEVGSALTALQDVLRVDNLRALFKELGLDDLPAVGGDAQFVQTLAAAAGRCSAVEAALDALAEKVEADDQAGRLEAVAGVIDSIAKLATALDAVATDLKRATANTANAAAVAAFAEEMAARVIEAAIVRYLESVHPVVQSILAALTLVEVTPLPLLPEPTTLEFIGDGAFAAAEGLQSVPLARRRLHLDRLGQLLTDPLAFLKTAYDWGDERFDGKKLFAAISQLFDTLGPLSVVEETGDAAGILSFFALSFAPTTDAHPPGIDGLLHVDVAPSADTVLAQLNEDWRFSSGLPAGFGVGLGLRLLPPAQLEILPPRERWTARYG